MPRTESKKDAKSKLLEAALTLLREKGYAATSVDELCSAAGVTKGAFFHHFKSKEELAVAAADYWSELTSALFMEAPYHAPASALERLLAYVEFRKQLMQGPIAEFTCLVGTLVQEIYDTAPAIRVACERCITKHAATLEADIEEALRERNLEPEWTPRSLALHAQAVIQGAFILAKASDNASVATESLDHLSRYIQALFASESQPKPRPRSTKASNKEKPHDRPRHMPLVRPRRGGQSR